MLTTRALLAAVAALAMLVLTAPSASAHTAMLRASPDRDAIVGGSIAFLDLEFLDPVTDATVTVTYNGAPVTGQTTVPDGDVITFTLDQTLTQPGRYQVNYEMISFDGDFTTGGYFFTFDPNAEPTARINPSGSGGVSSTTLVASGAALAVLAALVGLFVWRIDRGRRTEGMAASDGTDTWYDDSDHWDDHSWDDRSWHDEQPDYDEQFWRDR